MLLKHWNLILIFLTFSIISCESSKNEPEVNSTPSFPVGREFNVSLNIAPFLEVAEQPLSRSTSMVADGIYAVNVFWKGKGLTSFQPYASGLFDNPYRVEIGLIEGYVYRFDCSFLGYKDRPYYTIQSDSILYGLPFSSTLQKEVNGLVNNDLKISINPLNINGAFHQHIYKGEMHIKCDSTSTHPTVKRFFGSEQLDFSNPNMNTSVSMTLKRAYYSIQFVTDELAPGDSIKIKAADVAPFYLLYSKDGTSRTEERIISMYDISDYYTAKLKEEETIAFTISYRPANEEKWYSLYTNQSIKMKRNKKNIIKIVKIDEHIGDATISFGEEAEMEESEQEILTQRFHSLRALSTTTVASSSTLSRASGETKDSAYTL